MPELFSPMANGVCGEGQGSGNSEVAECARRAECPGDTGIIRPVNGRQISRWTPEMDAALIRMWQEGHDADTIAEYLSKCLRPDDIDPIRPIVSYKHVMHRGRRLRLHFEYEPNPLNRWRRKRRVCPDCGKVFFGCEYRYCKRCRIKLAGISGYEEFPVSGKRS